MIAGSNVLPRVQILPDYLVLQVSEHERKYYEDAWKDIEIGEGKLLPRFSHHDLHAFTVFPYDVLDKLLRYLGLVRQRPD
jgi:hypothetical protein